MWIQSVMESNEEIDVQRYLTREDKRLIDIISMTSEGRIFSLTVHKPDRMSSHNYRD